MDRGRSIRPYVYVEPFFIIDGMSNDFGRVPITDRKGQSVAILRL